jgi:hypothetical protein
MALMALTQGAVTTDDADGTWLFQGRGLPLSLRKFWDLRVKTLFPDSGTDMACPVNTACLLPRVVVSLYCLLICYKKKSACEQPESTNNLIKIIKVIACKKSRQSNYYREAVWEDKNC